MRKAADGRVVTCSDAVRAESIRTLYRQNAALLLVNPLNSAIAAFVLWPWRSPAFLLGWVAATMAVAAGRIWLRRSYLAAAPPPDQTSLWAWRFVIGATISGLLWGIAGALFYDPQSLAQILVIFIIGGMVAGACGTLALHMPAFFGFSLSAIVPTAARIFLDGGDRGIGMGGLTLVYGVAMSLVAGHINRAVSEALKLRFEKQALLDELTSAQISLAESNRTLEQRVAERGQALEKQSEALRDAQRMESIGLLAGGVAHDFNNLLTVVFGNLDILSDNTHLRAADLKALSAIGTAADRGANLIAQLLAFSRRQVVLPSVLDLNGVVSEVESLLGRLIGKDIELTVRLHPGTLAVKADSTQLHQIVINLAMNARDAMPSGGKLTIETAFHEQVEDSAKLPIGQYASLSVRDTGIGMDYDTKRMVFDPFFTTKEIGRGAGLGLATVYGVVEQSGGHIVVESEPGIGSCFRVLLPAVSEKIEAAPVEPERSAGETAGATILVAEDESAVRELTGQVLRTAGFTIIEAENGAHALEIARDYAGPLHLLVSDVVMPKLGGVDLAKHLIQQRPDLRVLLVSGYSPEQIPLSEGSVTIDFLQKPYTRNELLDKVRKVLAANEPPPRASSANMAP